MRRGLIVSFLAIFALQVLFQIWRLNQDDPRAWLSVDYLMRVAALVALAAARPTRHLAFKPRTLRIGKIELVAWLLGALALAVVCSRETLWKFSSMVLPDLPLGTYPAITGGSYVMDMTFGLGLVAVHEEIFFRRVARLVFRPLGDGIWMVVATSLIFGLFHWWSGLANMLLATVAGAFLMVLYRRAGALWPAIVGHYLVDLFAFS